MCPYWPFLSFFGPFLDLFSTFFLFTITIRYAIPFFFFYFHDTIRDTIKKTNIFFSFFIIFTIRFAIPFFFFLFSRYDTRYLLFFFNFTIRFAIPFFEQFWVRIFAIRYFLLQNSRSRYQYRDTKFTILGPAFAFACVEG